MAGQDESITAVTDWARSRLTDAGIDQPRREARLLLELARGDVAAFRVLVERRARHEPFAYIAGTQGFWTLELAVSAATLIPRADSEALIESLLALRPDRARALRMLDLGTGSGCLLLAALSEYPRSWGIGIDRSEAACTLAAVNAEASGLAGRSAFLCGVWSDALARDMPRFDLVLSNPPYIRSGDIACLMPEVARFEPLLALDGGADGLDAYRSILSRMGGLLADDGVAILELGVGQIDEIRPIAAQCGLAILSEQADLAGITRAVALAREPVL